MGRTPVDKMMTIRRVRHASGKIGKACRFAGRNNFLIYQDRFWKNRFRTPGESAGSQGRCPVGAYKPFFQGKRKVHAAAFNDCRKGGKFLQRHQDSRLRLEETVQLLIRIIGKANERMIGLEERIKRLEEAVAEKSMRQ